MVIELITSNAYVNNLRNFLPENPNSKSSALEKSKKIFNKIINSGKFIFDINDTRITDTIKKLISIRPGRTLFKRLLNAITVNEPLKIVFDPEKSAFNWKRKQISIASKYLTERSYKICANYKGEKILASSSYDISLAHELVHALHYFEDGPKSVKEKKKKDILACDLKNMEEQETIIGKEGEGSLCENLFRFHFGYPLRINHAGLWLKSEETFTASTFACHGTLVNLKEILLSNPSLLNLPQQSPGTKYAKKMTPLNASIVERQVEISNYLFQVGVDVNARDERWGTALHAAIHTQQLDMVKKLLEKGANPDVKDPKGRTALELAIQLKNDQARELLAPLNKRAAVDVKNPKGRTALELASEVKHDKARELLDPSIFHRALKVGSLVCSFFKSLLFDPLFAICKSPMGAFPFKDQERALNFYTEKLGFKVALDAAFEDQRRIELKLPGTDTLVDLFTSDDQKEMLGKFSKIVFSCNVKATTEQLKDKGVEIVKGPMEESWGTFTIFKDSKGNQFCLSPIGLALSL